MLWMLFFLLTCEVGKNKKCNILLEPNKILKVSQICGLKFSSLCFYRLQNHPLRVYIHYVGL